MSNEVSSPIDFNEDFIGVYDGCCSPQVCDGFIEMFKVYAQLGRALPRQQYSPSINKLHVDDTAIDVYGVNMFDVTIREEGKVFDNLFWPNCYRPYADKFSILKMYDTHKIMSMKLQRTTPGEGYHVWHTEASTRDLSHRILTFVLYLNDVEEGGETEFLYQRRRVKPKKGTCVIWPAGFTHPHRGNPPLTGEKYVLTGWVEF